eukprot:7691992-Alexandrium_andersonii.AAC.1
MVAEASGSIVVQLACLDSAVRACNVHGCLSMCLVRLVACCGRRRKWSACALHYAFVQDCRGSGGVHFWPAQWPLTFATD